MRVLIVEDDKNTIEVLVQELQKIPRVSVEIARSKSAAETALQVAEFDFVINDLKIPTTDDALDADKVHGLAVHSYTVPGGLPQRPHLVIDAAGVPGATVVRRLSTGSPIGLQACLYLSIGKCFHVR